MPYRVVEKEKVEQADVIAIAMKLQQYNLERGPEPKAKAVVLTVEDDAGTIAGGLFGKCAYGWMFVEFLVMPGDARGEGLGTQLMQKAETIAREHGCSGIYLSTLAFQARPFYEKLGFVAFGELTDFPAGQSPHAFMMKRIAQ